ncbi:MAG: hypothetical protein N2596_02860 [Syntrophorhabdaceae bacterium]|nr:hypothetical protein [Syntrophorhabdaceae bacterium]
MNKKAKRKAFFICLTICLMNLLLAIKIPERFDIRRISEDMGSFSNNLSFMSPKTQFEKQEKRAIDVEIGNKNRAIPSEITDKETALKNRENEIEPMFFISIPILSYMIKNKALEQDVLIPSSNNTWKKPFQIIRDKDREGIKNLSSLIGKGNIISFLKKVEISYNEGLDAEELLTGIGYTVDKERILAIFDENVDQGWDGLFPFIVEKHTIVKTEKGFKFADAKKIILSDKREVKSETEWIMPDLKDLPIRNAIEQLNTKTARIKVFGSGFVMDQYPKANEIVKSDGECILYGRMSN